ncbi:MAG: radical SAM protein [Patulibacter sp.]
MEFESQSGTTYYYDNEIGIAFPSHPLLKKMIAATPLHKEEISVAGDDEDFLFYSRFLEKLNKIRPKRNTPRKHTITADEVKSMVLREGMIQMTLGVTEDCNLRCRYCIFSDVYTLSRNRSRNVMDFPTAKKALDYYMSLFLEGREYNPLRRPSIGFYGGEPLLNFDLIKKCVQYLKTAYPELDFHFSVTTNGTLLTKEKEEFLKEHGFYISISIDGPKEEHDRNRVYPNGKGTFSDVIKNANRLIASGYDRCNAICVFDWKSNIFDLEAFFSRPDVPKLSIISSPAKQGGCTYFSQFSEEDFKAFKNTESRAFQYYLEHAAHDMDSHSFFSKFFSLFASRSLYSVPVLVPREQTALPYSGTCVPGRKIFVDCQGNFHPCERINQFFPTGNVQFGLDFQRIAGIMNEYLEHLDSCNSCSISKTCGFCYTQFAQKGCFDYASDICKDVEDFKKIDYSRTFTIGENHPHLLDVTVKDYYSWLSKISPTLGD